MLVIGTGRYANAGVMDGYACLLADGVQRNRRFSRHSLPGDASTSLGPLRWTVLDPLRSWRLVLADDREGFGFDLTWKAIAAPFAVEPITVLHEEGESTDFSHFVQPGEYEGFLRIDGQEVSVSGWRGLRDRSWGVRRTRERLGLHLWGGGPSCPTAVSLCSTMRTGKVGRFTSTVQSFRLTVRPRRASSRCITISNLMRPANSKMAPCTS